MRGDSITRAAKTDIFYVHDSRHASDEIILDTLDSRQCHEIESNLVFLGLVSTRAKPALSRTKRVDCYRHAERRLLRGVARYQMELRKLFAY